VLGDRIATLRVRHAASNRFVMCGADGVGFNPDFDEGNVGTIVLSRDSMKK
jgi:hypothetical protein